MDYAEILRDAWAFTRQGVFENAGRWIRLVLAIILLAIPMNGYMMRIYRGAESAPEVDQWGQMSIDGLKLMVVSFIYSIPIWLVWLATYGAMMAGIFTGQISDAALSAWEPNMGLVVLMYIIEFAIALVLPVVAIRFARSNRFSEAFNFRGIFDHMAKIGWINYVLSIILVAIVVAVPVMALVFVFIILGIVLGVFTAFSLTAILGIIAIAVLVLLILAPLFMVFQARCWTRIYDSVTLVV
jgi:hypothetical protein